MKKFLTLVLALVMTLALAVPAMAFTDTTPADDGVPELDIYLVEYEDDEFFGFTGLPPADRGYAKNEIVAAIVELTVPEDYGTLNSADYEDLVFSGDNVSLQVAENSDGTNGKFMSSSNVKTAIGNITFGSKITLPITGAGFADDDTYKWLFFAKVTGDDASLTAKLDANNDTFDSTASFSSLRINSDYTVVYSASGDVGTFLIEETSGGKDLFKIEVDTSEKFKSTDMYIYDTTKGWYTVGVSSDRATLVFVGASGTVTSGNLYDSLMDIYEDVVVDDFGFDYFARGGVVNFKTFTESAASTDVEATVEIRPWTAYVTVPDAIVIDPPKTGDAASIVGVVMIVLAAAAVMAVRKVRA